jgi:recombination protein RecR
MYPSREPFLERTLMAYPQAMDRLLKELERLPGVGPRTAERFAYFLLRAGSDAAAELAETLQQAQREVRSCAVCFNLADRDPCALCADESRDRRKVLVVSQPKDVEAMEKAGWEGLYHVLLGGVVVGAPGNVPARTLAGLQERLRTGSIEELVLGLNPDLEGDGTSLVIADLVEQMDGVDVRVTRLARGVPVGSAIEYTNPSILAEAIQERRSLPSGSEA